MKNLFKLFSLVAITVIAVAILGGCVIIPRQEIRPLDTPDIFLGQFKGEENISTILTAQGGGVGSVHIVYEISIGEQSVFFEFEGERGNSGTLDLATLDFLTADSYTVRVRAVPRSHTHMYSESDWSDAITYNRVIYVPFASNIRATSGLWASLVISFDVVNSNPFLVPTHADIALIGDFPNYFEGFTSEFNVRLTINNDSGFTHAFNAVWSIGSGQISNTTEIEITLLSARANTGNREYRATTVTVPFVWG